MSSPSECMNELPAQGAHGGLRQNVSLNGRRSGSWVQADRGRAVDLPIGFGDRVDPEQPVIAAFLDQLRGASMQSLAVDPAIDDDVSDVETLRAVFPRHALGDHPEPGFRRSEMREARLSAEACGSAGEDDGAATQWNEATGGLAADEEAAEASDAPEILELPRGQRAEIDALIVASVRHDDVRRLEALARRHCAIEQPRDILLTCGIHRDRLGAAARRHDRPSHLPDLVRRPTGDEHDRRRRGHDATPVAAETLEDANSSPSSPVSCISRTMSQPPTKAPPM